MSQTSLHELPINSLDDANQAIYRIKECSSEGQVESLLFPLIRFFGLEYFVFVTLRRNDMSRESHRYLIGCLPEWCQMYNARKWYSIDPFVQYALRNSSPIIASAVKPETPGQAELLATAAQYGFKSGMVIPAHDGFTSRVGVLYLGSSKAPEILEPRLLNDRNLLRAIAMELFEWWQAKIQAEAIVGLKLDHLDLELLKMQYEQFTTGDIAESLGLSTSQVNNRFRRINYKLNVNNKKQATNKAIEIGLLRV